jgi:hypothetical protein
MRWRCYHCNAPVGYEFEGSGPSCPSCKRAGSALIVPLVDVHYLGMTPDGPIIDHYGQRVAITCMPKRPTVVGVMATPELTSVSCPNCIKSELFQASWNEWAEIFPDLAKAHLARQTLIL